MTEFSPDPGVVGRELSWQEVWGAMCDCGRNDAPWIVWALFERMPVDVAARAVAEAWSAAEMPQRNLAQADWRRMFEHVGYTENGRRAPRPADAIELYRGSLPAHRRRWSWTSDQIMAERFSVNRAAQFGWPEDGDFLWRAVVPPSKLYARIHDEGVGRGESEYVVDTRGLRIEPIPFDAIAARVRQRLAAVRVVERESS